MPIYKIEAQTETNPKVRLVSAKNQAQALKHVTADLFKVDALEAEEVADMFINHGITKVENANNGE